MLIEQRSSLRGEITVPGDKSISHRAILFGSLAKGTSEIEGILMSEDCISTIECLRRLQIGINILPNNCISISGKGLHGLTPAATALNAGNSDIAIRLLLSVLTGQRFPSILTCAQPRTFMGNIVNPLRQMGANITGKEDATLCPLTIRPSKLKGITYEASLYDSYIKTPLLIASLYAEDNTTVIEKVKSRDHSELMLNCFGANIETKGLSVTSQRVENLYGQHIEVPGDLTIAAYFITAALLVPNSELTIKNVGINPTRTGILDVYLSMGGKIEIANIKVANHEKSADIHIKSSSLSATIIEADQLSCIMDEIQVFMIAATLAKGTTQIKGVKKQGVKEINRIKALTLELSKLGASIQETEDEIMIEGGKPLRGTIIESHNDDAIAMAMSIAGLIAEGETMIRKAQIIDITFPEFYTTLNRL